MSEHDASIQLGWKGCLRCGLLFFQHGARMGRCAAGGIHHPRSSGAFGVMFEQPAINGEPGWRWCRNCECLFHKDPNAQFLRAGSCPSGGWHDGGGSGKYVLHPVILGSGAHEYFRCASCHGLHDYGGRYPCAGGDSHQTLPAPFYDLTGTLSFRPGTAAAAVQAQFFWRLCGACNSIFFQGNAWGVCPAVPGGGFHNPIGSPNYGLMYSQAGVTGHRFKWCSKCKVLFDPAPGGGFCPAASGSQRGHDSNGSGTYLLESDGLFFRVCRKCRTLVQFFKFSPGVCARGGGHDVTQSPTFNLLTLPNVLT